MGLGEEQLRDPARPNAPVNNQTQIMTLAKMPENEQPAATAAKGAASAKKKPAKKR